MRIFVSSTIPFEKISIFSYKIITGCALDVLVIMRYFTREPFIPKKHCLMNRQANTCIILAHIVLLLALANRGVAQSIPVLSNPSGCQLNLPIVDNNCPENAVYYQPNEFHIQVNNAPAGAMGLQVYLKEVHLTIRHTWTGDLDILLVAPNGRSAYLTSDNGGGDDNYGNPFDPTCAEHVTFAVGACTSITQGAPPFTNTVYRPEDEFYVFNDSITPANGIWKLFICDDVAQDTGALDYINLVFAPIECLPLTAVQVLAVDTTTVTLSWTPNNFCGTTVIEYGPPGFTPGTGFSPGTGGGIAFGVCPPFDLTGLDPDTDYDIYVRRFCSGFFSINSCVVAAHTGCDPPPITIVEDFDDQNSCAAACPTNCALTGKWRNGPGDEHDWIAFSGGTPTLGTGPVDDVPGGGKYVFIETTGNSCAFSSKAMLYSSCIQLNKMGADTCHMSFNYHMFGTNIGTLRLEVSTNGGFNWSTIWQKSGNLGNQWNKEYLSLDNYPNGTVMQFRFVGVKGNGSRGDIALDNIVFYGSTDLGFPGTQYYVDADGDGYGRPGNFVLSCSNNPPAGYAANAQDCNDNNPLINPGMPEIACDNIDNNCNGPADDPILPTPPAVGDTICSGLQAVVCATPPPGQSIFWYGSATGTDLLHFGNCYMPVLPPNNSPNPVEYRYYASATNFTCFSGVRAEVVVVVNPNPDLSAAPVPAICPGESYNLASVQISDANLTGGQISFHSSTPAQAGNQLPSSIVSPVVPTVYYFKMTTSAGCSDEGSLVLGVNGQPGLAFSPADSFSLCKDAATAITATGLGGSAPYTYAWSNGAAGATIEVAGGQQSGLRQVLQVTITDELGCTAVDSVIVTTTNSIDSIARQVVNVTTCGGSNGSISLTPLNGLAPFAYQWSGSNGVTGSASGIPGAYTIANLPQGEYRITVTDNSSAMCQLVLRSVLVQGPAAVVEDVDIVHVNCPGGNDGQICLTIDGNNPSILWSNNLTGNCISNLNGGVYSATITDGACTTILNNLIVQEPEPIIIKGVLTPPSCHQSANGSINVDVFNGTPGYFYLWSNNKTTEDINNLNAGTYTITVTDIRGCTASASFTLEAPDLLDVGLVNQAMVSCNGLSNGFLLAGGLGGTPPYQYAWNGGQTGPLRLGLPAGNYSVTVTDFKGCTASRPFQVTQPAPLTLAVVNVNHPTCLGNNNGAIAVLGQGGTPAYEFIWNTSQNGNQINNLAVGNYSVFVRDANNCTSDTAFVTLTPTSTLNLDIQITPPPCVGPSSGAIKLTPAGTPPFTYQWARGDVSAMISQVGVGVYPVTITDGQGCIYDTTVTVNAPQVIDVELAAQSPTCAGVADGLIDVLVLQSGTPPVFFNWNDGIQTADRNNLGPGNYQLTVTDIGGCRFVTESITLTAPTPMVLKIEAIGEIVCYGDSSAFVELNMVGGIPPYSYQWVNLGLSTEDVYNLPEGEYRLIVLDANNCPIDTTFIFESPSALEAGIELSAGQLCNPASADTLSAVVTGGNLPYHYAWNSGTSSPTIYNASPADYILTVTDDNGCTAVTPSYKLRERPPALKLDSFTVSGISCFGAADASMQAAISGGSGSYLYHFTPSYLFQTGDTLVNVGPLVLSPQYSVTITDMNTGCQISSAPQSITEPLPLLISRDGVDEVNCFGGFDGGIYISVFGGTSPYQYAWYNGTGVLVSNNQDLTNAPADTYTVEVIDANGCTTSLTDTNVVEINPPILINNALTLITPVACKGDSSGAVNVVINGGVPPYNYEWSNGSQSEDLIDIPAGMYALTVTDADTCRAIFPLFEVEEPADSLIVDWVVTQPDCFNDHNGAIESTVSGGATPYTFVWAREGNILENQTGPALDNLDAAIYTLTVRDSNDCEKVFNILVEEPDLLTATIITGIDPSDGSVVASAIINGGTPGFEFLWNTGAVTDTIHPPSTGLYSVTVSDANGCTAGASAQIVGTHNPALVYQVSVYPNPAYSQAVLSWQFSQPLEARISLLDTNGRQLAAAQLASGTAGTHLLALDQFAAGVYLIKIESPESNFYYVTRLVVIR